MKRTLPFLLLLIGSISTSYSQQLSGQWIGSFVSNENRESRGTDYVLEIEVSGNQVSGYSYTYFSLSGKRYYVICRLKGTFDKGSKSLVVNEVEKVKTNTPPDFENCLQTHQLTYLKQKDKEALEGKWKPFSKESNCGTGITQLERKALVKNTAPSAPKASSPSTTKTASPTKKAPVPQKEQVIPTPVPPAAKTESPTTASRQALNHEQAEKKSTTKSALSSESGTKRELPESTKEKLTKRNYQVIRTIEVANPIIKIDVYDNGQIDGDVVSIFLNQQQLVASKMLTAQPISLQIKVEDEEAEYDLIMYAESLGSIPPNTALMIVYSGKERYEINISSNEQTSGAIRFKLKK
ncbi:MAG: hypothetical protein ACKO03_06605 [Bacteroidota bacterium]